MNSSFESLIEQYPLPIAEQLRHWAARYASRIAVVDAKGSLTYSALDAQVDELAAGLSSLGLRSGGACNCAASQRQRVCYPAVRLVKTGRYPRAGDALATGAGYRRAD